MIRREARRELLDRRLALICVPRVEHSADVRIADRARQPAPRWIDGARSSRRSGSCDLINRYAAAATSLSHAICALLTRRRRARPIRTSPDNRSPASINDFVPGSAKRSRTTSSTFSAWPSTRIATPYGDTVPVTATRFVLDTYLAAFHAILTDSAESVGGGAWPAGRRSVFARRRRR